MEIDEGLRHRLPIGFAHRGGPLHPSQANSLAAFSAALTAGARGLESDVQLTADGVPVLSHRTIPGRGVAISRLRYDQLPSHLTTLAQLYQHCGSDFDLALDTAAAAARPVVALARRHQAEDRLWLTYWRLPVLLSWRRRWPAVRLVLPSMAFAPFTGPRPLLRRLGGGGIDAINTHWRRSSAALITAAHDSGVLCFAWGARDGATVARQIALGVDGVFADDTQSMIDALASARRRL